MAFKGKKYYGEFLQSEEKIATNILADRLALLEQQGIVTKHTDPTHGSKLIYRLTQKGIDLVPVLLEFISWSAKYDKDNLPDEAKKFASRIKKDRAELIEEIAGRLKKELSS